MNVENCLSSEVLYSINVIENSKQVSNDDTPKILGFVELTSVDIR